VPAVLEQVEAFMPTIDEPAPGIHSRADLVRATLALASGDIAAAAGRAEHALRTAAEAGLRLVEIDALETVAVVRLAAGDAAAAARILGATTADRERRGYLGRLTTPATRSMVDSAASAQAGAWHAGTTEPLDRMTAAVLAETGPISRTRADAAG
jgi:hypothetical protein